MTEYFISYYETGNLHCRCSIGDLSVDEVVLFKKKSGIKKPYTLECSESIPLDLSDIRFDHNEALKKFECGNRLYDLFQITYQVSAEVYYSIPDAKKRKKFEMPHIVQMVEFKRIANTIREVNCRSTTPPTTAPSLQKNPKIASSPGRGNPKSTNECVKNMVNKWVAQNKESLSTKEKKICDWLFKSQNDHGGKGWQKMADADIKRMKDAGEIITPKKRKHARNIQNQVEKLLGKILEN